MKRLQSGNFVIPKNSATLHLSRLMRRRLILFLKHNDGRWTSEMPDRACSRLRPGSYHPQGQAYTTPKPSACNARQSHMAWAHAAWLRKSSVNRAESALLEEDFENEEQRLSLIFDLFDERKLDEAMKRLHEDWWPHWMGSYWERDACATPPMEKGALRIISELIGNSTWKCHVNLTYYQSGNVLCQEELDQAGSIWWLIHAIEMLEAEAHKNDALP